MADDLQPYSAFLRQLAERIERATTEAIEMGLADMNNGKGRIEIEMKLSDCRVAIGNLSATAAMLEALAAMEAGNG